MRLIDENSFSGGYRAFGNLTNPGKPYFFRLANQLILNVDGLRTRNGL